MNNRTWLLAAALALACASPTFAAPDPIGYTAPDGVNAVAVTAANPLPTTCLSGCASPTIPANIAGNQQPSIGTTSTSIVGARTGRQTVTVEQLGTTPVYLGPSGVTTATGVLLPGSVGASVTLNFTGAVFGVVGSGTGAVAYYELY